MTRNDDEATPNNGKNKDYLPSNDRAMSVRLESINNDFFNMHCSGRLVSE